MATLPYIPGVAFAEGDLSGVVLRVAGLETEPSNTPVCIPWEWAYGRAGPPFACRKGVISHSISGISSNDIVDSGLSLESQPLRSDGLYASWPALDDSLNTGILLP